MPENLRGSLPPSHPILRLFHFLVLITSVAVLATAVIIHICVLRTTSPQEYREPAMILQTDLLLHGQNPYAVKNQPVFTNVYGILYPLLVCPFAHFGGATFLVHRLLSGVFVVAIVLLLAWTLRGQQVGTTLCLAGAALLYADLALRNLTINSIDAIPLSLLARPDSLGMLLMFAAVLVPWRSNYSTRSLAASCVLAVLAFFAKPYFLIALPIVALHLLFFVSKQRAFIYAAAGALLFLALNVVANLLWPCYQADCIISNFHAGVPIPGHLTRQIKTYATFEPGLIILALSALFFLLRSPSFRPRFRFRKRNAPLLNQTGDLFTIWLLVALAALCWKLGRHGGNFMLYFQQLLSPPLIIIAVRFAGRAKKFWTLFILLDLVIALVRMPPIPRGHDDVWHDWARIIAPHAQVYAPAPLSEILLRQHKPIYESGLSDCFAYALNGNLHPSDDLLQARYRQFTDGIARRIDDRSFGLVILPYRFDKPFFTFIPTEKLKGRYVPVGEMDLPMDFQKGWTAIIFRRS